MCTSQPLAPVYRKTRWILIGTLLIHGALVATHLGEFWPFSIYPMFSQAGNPWSRAVVRDISDVDQPIAWDDIDSFDELPGTPFLLGEVNVNQNDIANFVSKSKVWDEKRIGAMRSVFGSSIDGRRILILRARGSLDTDDAVVTVFTPFLVLEDDVTTLNPILVTTATR